MAKSKCVCINKDKCNLSKDDFKSLNQLVGVHGKLIMDYMEGIVELVYERVWLNEALLCSVLEKFKVNPLEENFPLLAMKVYYHESYFPKTEGLYSASGKIYKDAERVETEWFKYLYEAKEKKINFPDAYNTAVQMKNEEINL